MKRKPNRLTKAILDTAKDMQKIKVIDRAEYEKITLRHIEKENLPPIK